MCFKKVRIYLVFSKKRIIFALSQERLRRNLKNCRIVDWETHQNLLKFRDKLLLLMAGRTLRGYA
jgi:hypothetical protein